ncbi:MAG: elongation factor Ts [Chloroflexi bacterium]|nr:elongation factor Ts [Chloroflexota bacterium]
MAITLEMIKELREKTGAGVLDCRKALESAAGDLARAQQILYDKGLAAAARKAERETKQGLIEAYVHLGKAAAIVELNCETDFVARTAAFKELAHNLAMQVVALRPQYVRPEDIPADVLEKERAAYRAQLEGQDKPDHLLAEIIEKKLLKFYTEVCLLNQSYIRDQEKTVQDVVNEVVAATGENIVVRRFARLELNEQES